MAQGYFISKPITAPDFDDLLAGDPVW